MNEKKNLRYQRTEKAIREAFMDLAAGQPVTSVTVKELRRRADISRNAFYLHHTGIMGLYATLIDDLVEDVRAESLASSKRRTSEGDDELIYEAMLSSLARHEQLLRALLPSDDGALAKCLADGIRDAFIESALSFGEHGGSFEHGLRCAYAAWGLVGFATEWITNSNSSLIEGLDLYREMDRSVVESSARFLMDGKTRA